MSGTGTGGEIPTLKAPPSPDFHGFGPQTYFPARLIIETEGVDDEEAVVRVSRQRGRGRPRREDPKPQEVNPSNILCEPRRERQSSSSSTCPVKTPLPSSASPARAPTPSSSSGSGTRTRQREYLLDNPMSTFSFAKLPKASAVLSVFLHHLSGSDPQGAAMETVVLLKEVWLYHFGMKLILGFDSITKQHNKKIISDDKYIQTLILDLWKEWMALKKTSLRPDRASKPSFKRKEEDFVNMVLDMPFKILCRNYEENIRLEAGIKDWREDLQHLHNQVQREQVGTCGGYDTKQKKRDDRKYKELLGGSKAAVSGMDEIEEDEDFDQGKDQLEVDDDRDGEYVEKERKERPVKKVDVMGPVSATADRLGLSVRQRCMLSASVVNALGVDISTTNINRNSAWLKGKEERITKATAIRESFQCPELVVVHWDGKILTMKGNVESNRVAVYVSGLDSSGFRKLLGCPETSDGTGRSEAEVVQKLLESWGVGDQVCGLVFDTTASNTGSESGACKILEDWCDISLLWLACRHHIHELHVKRVFQGIFGETKDPGVSLFRKLKSSWNSLTLDYDKLHKIDLTTDPEWVQEEAKQVLDWALKHLAKNTWPRADYKELLELAIICLGGEVPGFQFRLPGPDHHARWMSKCIYNLKLSLLLNIFEMSETEKEKVLEVSKYILIFYIKHWFESPLPAVAARNDLSFMVNILKYRHLVKPSITFSILQSCRRHLWYLVPQTVVFALVDPGLPDDQKERMARQLYSLPRTKINMGKPEFPYIDFSGQEVKLPDLADFVTSDSWLIFDKLGLLGSQDWLTIPPSLWNNFQEYRKFREFVQNVSVCNDIAERGVSLITTFINLTESEEQRQAMLQVVEHHRSMVVDTTKASLKLC